MSVTKKTINSEITRANYWLISDPVNLATAAEGLAGNFRAANKDSDVRLHEVPLGDNQVGHLIIASKPTTGPDWVRHAQRAADLEDFPISGSTLWMIFMFEEHGRQWAVTAGRIALTPPILPFEHRFGLVCALNAAPHCVVGLKTQIHSWTPESRESKWGRDGKDISSCIKNTFRTLMNSVTVRVDPAVSETPRLLIGKDSANYDFSHEPTLLRLFTGKLLEHWNEGEYTDEDVQRLDPFKPVSSVFAVQALNNHLHADLKSGGSSVIMQVSMTGTAEEVVDFINPHPKIEMQDVLPLPVNSTQAEFLHVYEYFADDSRLDENLTFVFDDGTEKRFVELVEASYELNLEGESKTYMYSGGTWLSCTPRFYEVLQDDLKSQLAAQERWGLDALTGLLTYDPGRGWCTEEQGWNAEVCHRWLEDGNQASFFDASGRAIALGNSQLEPGDFVLNSDDRLTFVHAKRVDNLTSLAKVCDQAIEAATAMSESAKFRDALSLRLQEEGTFDGQVTADRSHDVGIAIICRNAAEQGGKYPPRWLYAISKMIEEVTASGFRPFVTFVQDETKPKARKKKVA